MTKNPVSGPILVFFGLNFIPKNFLWVLPLLYIMQCCKLSLYAISRKINEPNWKKMAKNLVLGLILANLAQIRSAKFFIKNLAPSATRYHGELS